METILAELNRTGKVKISCDVGEIVIWKTINDIYSRCDRTKIDDINKFNIAELEKVYYLDFNGIDTTNIVEHIGKNYINLLSFTNCDLSKLQKIENVNVLYIYDCKLEKCELYGLKSLAYRGHLNFLNMLPISLTYLDLSGNSLTTVPEEIYDLINLQSLYLYSNRIRLISPKISNLNKLLDLYLFCNQIVELPETICDMQLSEINIRDNRIELLPIGINKLYERGCNIIMDTNPIFYEISGKYQWHISTIIEYSNKKRLLLILRKYFPIVFNVGDGIMMTLLLLT